MSAAQSNVVTLRRRRGRPRKAPPGHTGTVLAFTGKKRFVYDRAAVLDEHKQGMVQLLMQTWMKVNAGEITGLMLYVAEGDSDDEGVAEIRGLFRDQPEHAISSAEFLLDYAEELRDEASNA